MPKDIKQVSSVYSCSTSSSSDPPSLDLQGAYMLQVVCTDVVPPPGSPDTEPRSLGGVCMSVCGRSSVFGSTACTVLSSLVLMSGVCSVMPARLSSDSRWSTHTHSHLAECADRMCRHHQATQLHFHSLPPLGWQHVICSLSCIHISVFHFRSLFLN